MNLAQERSPAWIRPVAKTGLFAKGIVYCLIGLLALMSAFQINGQAAGKSDKAGSIQFLLEMSGGKIVLLFISIGLLAYSVWRFLQTFLDTEHKGSRPKGIAKRFGYFFSGLTYLSICFLTVKAIIEGSSDSGGSSNSQIQSLMKHPLGMWVMVVIGLIFTGIGVYQIWYGSSEKYRNHVDVQKLSQKASFSLLRAGKAGYISRGIVWLIVSFLFLKAAYQHNASEAGGTGSAFSFVQEGPFGTYLLAALALGLICYGVMNFIRAAFENLDR
ncbi:DUF1206 domain-containing protein [Desertivirga xinjiangensis]|uniref:DUF1206 domain-containing protein n=1 Tax=Desertivirga xinjiangensis TaxID=539206 RepID=UPI0021086076|nr:DUF1206 domain-containing protein [Pedobacter xinjiangensis]